MLLKCCFTNFSNISCCIDVRLDGLCALMMCDEPGAAEQVAWH